MATSRADQPQQENAASLPTLSKPVTVSSLNKTNNVKPIRSDEFYASNSGNATTLSAGVEGNAITSMQPQDPGDHLNYTSQANPNDERAKTSTEQGEKESSVTSHAPHLEAIELLRTTYYHKLPVEKKLNILEFLLDELLQSRPISTEFTNRDSSHEESGIFGTPPTETELISIKNVDDC
eukprot:CAMPEP_0196809494 /NCGR_PEP_ID=MMETSP1362-20130617/9426_1 /TAXON_ID=163516 /ORGANISM="Leptocylindrus danicus, Strain CCMP1856" /LENGTH=179 /DNA_ID=CAMNT_0042184207 /DNA_START=1 /DNA_END=537 /DNA_ORIENTATION=+